jgi:hypothetical protein
LEIEDWAIRCPDFRVRSPAACLKAFQALSSE